MISAGFDGHRRDPLELGCLDAADYHRLTAALCAAAARLCGGRVVSVLEGGYGVDCCGEEPADVGTRTRGLDVVGAFGVRPAAARRKEAFDTCVRQHLDALIEHGSELGRA